MKRQVPFGPYILDFAIPAAKLVIEADGQTHGTETSLAWDARRDDFLRGQGWRVLRFTNHDVLTNLNGILTTIALAAGTNPLPQAGEGVDRK